MRPNPTPSRLLKVLPSLALLSCGALAQEGGTFRKLFLEIDPKSDCTVEAPTKEIATMPGSFPVTITCPSQRFVGSMTVSLPTSTSKGSPHPQNPNILVLDTAIQIQMTFTGSWTPSGNPQTGDGLHQARVTASAPRLPTEPDCRFETEGKASPGETKTLTATGSCPLTALGRDARTFPEGIAYAILAGADFDALSPLPQRTGSVILIADYTFGGPKLGMDAKLGARNTRFQIKVTGQGFATDSKPVILLPNGNPDPDLSLSGIVVNGTTEITAELSVGGGAALGGRRFKVVTNNVDSEIVPGLDVVDLTFDVNQGTKRDPDLTRIANHPTAVRAFFDAPGVSRPATTGLLYLFKDGAPLAGSPFETSPALPFRNTVDVKASYDAEEKFFLKDSLNFYFGADLPGGRQLPAGSYELLLAWNPYDPTALPQRLTGSSKAQVLARRDMAVVDTYLTPKLVTTNPFRILVYTDPSLIPRAKTGLRSSLETARRYLAAAYPIDGEKLVFDIQESSIVDPAGFASSSDPGKAMNTFLSRQLALVNRFAADSGGTTYDRLAFVTISDRATAFLGTGTLGLANTSTYDTLIAAGDTAATMSHELGHTFTLGETYCGWGCSNYLLNVWSTCYTSKINCIRSDALANGNRVEAGAVRLLGLDDQSGRSRPTFLGASASVADGGAVSGGGAAYQRLDLMSNANSDNDRWPDLVEWSYLLSRLRGSARESKAAGDVLVVRATLKSSGALTFSETVKTSVTPATSEPGDVTVELLDASGSVLSSATADARFVESEVGVTSETGIAVALAWSASARQVRVRQGSKVLGTRPLSPNPPTVRVTGPAAGTLTGPTTVAWQASDPDGDPLTYSVFYLPDGKTPIPFAPGLTGTSTSFNPAGTKGGIAARFLVVATDGTHEARGLSETVTVPRGAPTPGIVSPEDGVAVPAGQDVALVGAASDPEDGSIPGSRLTFRSSRDGTLGTGSTVVAKLTTGTHTLTLRAVDLDGNATETSVTVTAADGAPVLTSVSPASGAAGAVLTLTGSGFDAATASVRFGTQAATPTGVTATSMRVTVPSGLAVGPTDVAVVSKNLRTSTFRFSVLLGRPKLTRLNPVSGPTGTVVFAEGSELDPAGSLRFGSLDVKPASATASRLVASVPSGLSAGNVNVTATSSRGSSDPVAFNVTTGAPTGVVLTSVTPSSGAAGTLLTIRGSGFSSDAVRNAVGFGGVGASPVSTQPDSLTVRVPSGLALGAVDVNVSVNGFPSNPLPFTVTSPGGGGGTGTRRLVIPVVLSTPGLADSFFTSELTLTNRGSTDATLDLTYTAAAGGGSGSASDSLPPGRQKVVADAIEYLRTLGVPIPATGSRVGTLEIRFSGLSSPTAGAATVRTTTVVAGGRAGLSYGSLTPLTGPAYLFGLRQTATDRSNVAFVHAGTAADGGLVLAVTAYSGDPLAPLTAPLPPVSLAPGGFFQISQVLASNGLSLTNGYVKVERQSGSVPFFAYGVVNDQANSDGSFVPPVSPGAAAGLTLPVAVEAGSFTTELILTNAGTTTKTVQLAFVADAIQTSGNTGTVTLTLRAGEQRILPSFVQYLRDQRVAGVGASGTTFAGAVFVTVPGGDTQGIAVGARTSAPGGGGRYGLYYVGVPYGQAAEGGAWLYGLLQNAQNRSNLAIVNTGERDGSPSSFKVELYDAATGALANVVDVPVSARRFVQLSSILTSSAPGVASAYAHVTRTSGTNPFLTYVVVNDGGAPNQRSDDGAFVSMEIEETANPARLEVTPASVDFGSVTVGQTKDQTLTVRNAGGGTLSGSAAATAPFSVASGASFSLAAGESQTITVRYSPGASGPASGALSLTSNGGSATVALTGSGSATATPRIEVTPASLDFGSVAVGSSRDLDLTVRNGGSGTLTVSGATSVAPFSVTTAVPFTLTAGASRSVTVRFTPTSAASISSTLTLASNDPSRPTVPVSLSGQGTGGTTTTEELVTDDGTVETGVYQNGLLAVNRLTPSRYPATLQTIRIFFQPFSGLPSPSGAQIRLVVFTDPSGQGRPPAGVQLLTSAPLTLGTIPAGGTFIDYPVTGVPSLSSGDLYVGFASPNPVGGVVFAADSNGVQRRRGWYSTDGGSTFLGPLGVSDGQGGVTPVNILVRATVSIPGARSVQELTEGSQP